jgi:hypothetical protein
MAVAKEITVKERLRRIMWLGVWTLVTSLVWVALESYHRLIEKEQTKKVGSLIDPVNPEIKAEVVAKIEERREYRLEEVNLEAITETLPEMLSEEATESGKTSD